MLDEVWPEIGNAWVSGLLAGSGSVLVQWLAPKAGRLLRQLRAPNHLRLERRLAARGCICISGDAWRHVRGAIAAEFVDLGERRLKNSADPAHVFAISPAA